MVYKKDFIYNIYGGTHVTDEVMDDIFWIHGTRKPWFNTRLGAEKIKNNRHLIYAFYILYVIYIVYTYMHIIYLIYIVYILYAY